MHGKSLASRRLTKLHRNALVWHHPALLMALVLHVHIHARRDPQEDGFPIPWRNMYPQFVELTASQGQQEQVVCLPVDSAFFYYKLGPEKSSHYSNDLISKCWYIKFLDDGMGSMLP